MTLRRNGGGQKVGLTLCYGSPYDGFTDVFVGEVRTYILFTFVPLVWLRQQNVKNVRQNRHIVQNSGRAVDNDGRLINVSWSDTCTSVD